MLQGYYFCYVWWLVFFKNASWVLFFSSFETAVSPCPRVFRVKTKVQLGAPSSFWNAFWEAWAAVNRLTLFRLERYCGGFAAFIACNFKHSLFRREKSPLLLLITNWKWEIFNWCRYNLASDLKVCTVNRKNAWSKQTRICLVPVYSISSFRISFESQLTLFHCFLQKHILTVMRIHIELLSEVFGY